jgi:DNA polymerase II large subunit
MDIVVRIDAVEADGIANKILQSHFLRDISGNMRKFSQQGFRCTKCQKKYRRIPLSGKCNSCGGPIILTVTRGGIVKYLKKSLEISNQFNLGNYTIQRIELIGEYVKSLTDNPKIKQVKITSFFK